MTSEEKLLKLIRQKKPVQVKEDAAGKDAAKNLIQGTSLGSKKAGRRADFDTLGILNKILIVVCLGALILAGYRFAVLVGPGTEKKPKKEKEVLAQAEDRSAWPQAKPFEAVGSNIGSRNLFYNPWEKPVDIGQKTNEVNINFSAQFKVVGIVLDSDPKAIIEDVSNNQTYFLSQGDNLNSGIIKEILEDKVVINYNNQEIVLTP